MKKRTVAEQRAHFAQRLEANLVTARKRLRQTQARYKRDLDKRTRTANNKLQPGHYVFLDPDYGYKKKKKLGGHAEGPYRVLENAIRTFIIQRGADMERVNSDRVTRATAPIAAEPVHREDAAPEELQEKNIEGRAWLVRKILGHRVASNGQLELQIDWAGPYVATWEPRRNIPE